MNSKLQHQYVAVGHVTVDVLADGSRQPGGAAFYSALQAARLGMYALILTRGVPSEIEAMLEPYRDELSLEIQPADHTTTLATSGQGSEREQRVLAWAGPISDALEVDCSILHLAPVARETPTRWHGHCDFVGLTPQGMVREWTGADRRIALVQAPDSAEEAAQSSDAVVLSAHEHDCCSTLIDRARVGGATVAVTDGAQPTTLLLADGSKQLVPVSTLSTLGDDLGAGDVFAAAFFVALWQGRGPTAAGAFANSAAAVRMSGRGASAIGTTQAIDARLQRAAEHPPGV